MFDIMDYGNKVILINKDTGKWLALKKEGYNLISKYINGNENAPKEEIQAFINEINNRLNSNIEHKKIGQKGITLLLTNSCNFKCVHCFYNSSAKENVFLEVNNKLISFLKWYKQKRSH